MHFVNAFGILSLFFVSSSGFVNVTNSSTNGTSKDVLISQRYSVLRGYTLYKDLGSYYKYHIDPQTWQEARRICEAEGGYLVIINSEEEASLLRELMALHQAASLDSIIPNKDVIFIGFHDLFQFREWVTILDKTIETSGYAHWVAGEPNNYLGNERCGSFYRFGGLNDITCDWLLTFVCEIPIDTCDCDCN